MPTFTELLKSTAATLTLRPADKLAAAVSRLGEQVPKDQAEADEARLAYESALVDNAIDETSFDERKFIKLKAAADAAQDRLSARKSALALARAQLSSAQGAGEDAERKEQGRAMLAVINARERAADRLRATLAPLVEAYNALDDLNGKAYGVLNAGHSASGIDLDGSLLRSTKLDDLVRAELYRLGVPWDKQRFHNNEGAPVWCFKEASDMLRAHVAKVTGA
jgi:hypothetical protein